MLCSKHYLFSCSHFSHVFSSFCHLPGFRAAILDGVGTSFCALLGVSSKTCLKGRMEQDAKGVILCVLCILVCQ